MCKKEEKSPVDCFLLVGEVVFTALHSGHIYVWNFTTGELLLELQIEYSTKDSSHIHQIFLYRSILYLASDCYIYACNLEYIKHKLPPFITSQLSIPFKDSMNTYPDESHSLMVNISTQSLIRYPKNPPPLSPRFRQLIESSARAKNAIVRKSQMFRRSVSISHTVDDSMVMMPSHKSRAITHSNGNPDDTDRKNATWTKNDFKAFAPNLKKGRLSLTEYDQPKATRIAIPSLADLSVTCIEKNMKTLQKSVLFFARQGKIPAVLMQKALNFQVHESLELEKIVIRMQHKRGGIELGPRRVALSFHDHTFYGFAAINWLVSNIAVTRKEALNMCNLFIEKDMIKDVSFRKGKHFLEDHVYIFTMDKLIDLEHRRKEQRDKDQLEQIAKSPKTVSDISPSPTSLEVKPIPKPTAPILILSPHTSVNAIGSTGHEKSRSPIATTTSTFSDVKSSGEKKKCLRLILMHQKILPLHQRLQVMLFLQKRVHFIDLYMLMMMSMKIFNLVTNLLI